MWSKLKNWYKTRSFFAFIILFVLILVFMAGEAKNERFTTSDFRVYVTAAQRLWDGENLYRPQQDGHYYYKYSPTTAVYFLPFAPMPFLMAKIVYWLFLTGVFLLGLYMCISLVQPWYKRMSPQSLNNLILIVACIIGGKVHREFHLGQVNHLLLVMYIGMIFFQRLKKEIPISLIWALALFIKPHCLIFLPYYLIKKKFKVVAMFLLFAAILFIIPAVFFGFDMAIDQQLSWFHELTVDLDNKQDMLADGNLAIFSVLARYSPLRLIEFDPVTTSVYQAIVLVLISLFILFLLFKGHERNDAYIFEMGFLISLIPLIAPTAPNAFGFLQVIIFIIIFNWSNMNKWARWLAVIGFILYGGVMHDMVGHTLWMIWYNYSILTVGAIMILIAAANLRFRKLV